MHWSPDCLNTGLNVVALVCYVPLLFFITSVQFFIYPLVNFIAKNGGGVGWGLYMYIYVLSAQSAGEV